MAIWIWLVLGAGLCLAELILPTAFVAFMMGISALIVALLSPLIPQFTVQALLWLALSVGLVFLTKQLMPRRTARSLQDPVEAQTLTEILPGQAGRVLYEGTSWRGRCDDPDVTIPPQVKVYIIRREGTTLVVMPASMVHS